MAEKPGRLDISEKKKPKGEAAQAKCPKIA
jgi:hypothetical protein